MTSTQALFFYAALLVAGYLATIQYPSLPFGAFATALSGVTVAFITKRLIQKQNKYNNGDHE